MRHCSNWAAVLPLSRQWQTACWLCHRLNSLLISSYGDQSTTRNNFYIIIVLHQRCLNCSECFPRHLMFYTCNYNIRVTHRNGAIKHIFINESDPRRIINADCSLFILSLHALALHLAANITSNLSVWRFEHVIHIHLSVVFLQNASRTALCYATNTIKWKHS